MLIGLPISFQFLDYGTILIGLPVLCVCVCLHAGISTTIRSLLTTRPLPKRSPSVGRGSLSGSKKACRTGGSITVSLKTRVCVAYVMITSHFIHNMCTCTGDCLDDRITFIRICMTNNILAHIWQQQTGASRCRHRSRLPSMSSCLRDCPPPNRSSRCRGRTSLARSGAATSTVSVLFDCPEAALANDRAPSQNIHGRNGISSGLLFRTTDETVKRINELSGVAERPIALTRDNGPAGWMTGNDSRLGSAVPAHHR